MPKPLCRFLSSFDMFTACAHTHQLLSHSLCLSLCPTMHTHTHFKFNSFSIFAPFVPGSFKENGKFIEFILTRNMFVRRSLTHTCTLSCSFVPFALFRLPFRVHVMLMQSVRQHKQGYKHTASDTIKGKRRTNTRIIVAAHSLSERKEVKTVNYIWIVCAHYTRQLCR